MDSGLRRMIWIALFFLGISLATRVGLALFSGDSFSAGEWSRFVLVGLVFDLAVLPWIVLPWALYDAILPAESLNSYFQKIEFSWAALLGCLYLVVFSVVGVAEFAFWAEFGSRFDFIAVDYLVYTHEVIGNIRESYPLPIWMAGIFCICIAGTWLSWPRMKTGFQASLTSRWFRVAATSAVAALGFFFVDTEVAETKSDAYVQQLSGNGIYAFFQSYCQIWCLGIFIKRRPDHFA
jgi:hypothetical protein